NNKRDWNS
ncbi:hypothetical protein ACTFIZ_008699, partial [Dictyostelium cf. discoideum]